MSENGAEQILIFEKGGKAFGLELDRVEGITENIKITPVPMAPQVAEGIIFYRDGVLPVINLLRLLNIGSEEGGSLLVVVRGVSEDFGIPSDSIYGIAEADLLDLKYTSLEERESPYIQGTGNFKGNEFFLLDFKNI